jgi:hypothetical protein
MDNVLIYICITIAFINTIYIWFGDWLFTKLKKKTKTNEIKLEVEFTQNYNGIETNFVLVFLGTDLTDCVKQSIRYAKYGNCLIKSMTQLTTEE